MTKATEEKRKVFFTQLAKFEVVDELLANAVKALQKSNEAIQKSKLRAKLST
jgi:hypothetical protein